jgi:coenzyme PQQ precursor peptide PqqA
VNSFAPQHEQSNQVETLKILLVNFSFGIYFSCQGGIRPVSFIKESQMAWKTPKIVEVPVGMEINMYACAARK